MFWSSMKTSIELDLEEKLAADGDDSPTAVRRDASSLRDASCSSLREGSPSREAPQELAPPRRPQAISARRGIACSEPPSRLEFHLWSPRSTQLARAPQKHVLVRPPGAQAALDQLPAQAALRPGSCRRSHQSNLATTSSRRESFETQVLRLSTPVAARGAGQVADQVPSMRCSSTPMATPRARPSSVAASTPAMGVRVADVWCASPLQKGASESQQCREVLRYASRSTTPRAYPSAAERAYSSDSQRRRASLLFETGSHR